MIDPASFASKLRYLITGSMLTLMLPACDSIPCNVRLNGGPSMAPIRLSSGGRSAGMSYSRYRAYQAARRPRPPMTADEIRARNARIQEENKKFFGEPVKPDYSRSRPASKDAGRKAAEFILQDAGNFGRAQAEMLRGNN